MKYHVRQAHNFYKKFIYNEEKQALLKKHGLRVSGSVPSVDWELFGAILTGDDAKMGYGADLEHHEIKSAGDKGSFEYQYHLKGGVSKLIDDMKVRHVFISYSPDYKDLKVRIVDGSALKEKFKGWMPKLKANYKGPNRLQRFRRSISYGTVLRLGEVIMEIRQSEIVRVAEG
jgi:hypothetical protein